MIIDNSNNVGIGTDNPLSTLHVQGILKTDNINIGAVNFCKWCHHSKY